MSVKFHFRQFHMDFRKDLWNKRFSSTDRLRMHQSLLTDNDNFKICKENLSKNESCFAHKTGYQCGSCHAIYKSIYVQSDQFWDILIMHNILHMIINKDIMGYQTLNEVKIRFWKVYENKPERIYHSSLVERVRWLLIYHRMLDKWKTSDLVKQLWIK